MEASNSINIILPTLLNNSESIPIIYSIKENQSLNERRPEEVKVRYSNK